MVDVESVSRLTGLDSDEAAALLATHNGSCEDAVLAHNRAESTDKPTRTMLSQFLETTSESAVPDREKSPVDEKALAAYRKAIRVQTTPPEQLRDPMPRPTISLSGSLTGKEFLASKAWEGAPVAFSTDQDNVTVIRPTENHEVDIGRISEARASGQCVLVVAHAEGSARTREGMTPPLSPGETRRACIAEDGGLFTMSDKNFASELERCKAYEAAGAHGLLLHPTYDLSATLFFLEDVRQYGITMPCIPTVPVISDAAWVLARCRGGRMRVPRAIVAQLEKVKSDADMDRYGTVLAASMAKQLFQRGAANVCLSVSEAATPHQIASVLLGCGLARQEAG